MSTYFLFIADFSIIAHIDHGKSTLADCLLQLTGNITADQRKKGQVLDTLQVERERGITVKAQTASMIFDDAREKRRYLINLIDTPGKLLF
jgi:translation elongation factor EF-4